MNSYCTNPCHCVTHVPDDATRINTLIQTTAKSAWTPFNLFVATFGRYWEILVEFHPEFTRVAYAVISKAIEQDASPRTLTWVLDSFTKVVDGKLSPNCLYGSMYNIFGVKLTSAQLRAFSIDVTEIIRILKEV